MPANGRPLPTRSDSLQRVPSTSAADSLLITLRDEIHDMRRVQAYGQEEDLKEALGKMIGRVEELSSLFSQSVKSQSELETNLKLAKSNLQLALANNEMLEEALKRESASGSKDVGWRRWSENPAARVPRAVSEQVTEREKRRSGDSGRTTPSRRKSDEESSTPTTDASASMPSSPTPVVAQPPASPPQDNRFFRFRFGSSPSNPSSARSTASSSRPQTPPSRTRVDEVRDREAGHLTSVSLPSLVAHTNKREEELMAELEAEREKYAKVVKEKTSLEQELEGLSQALFEEANKMVAHERIKCADIQEELQQVRQEKEALKSAMRIIEQENTLLKRPDSEIPLSRSLASSSDLTPRSSRPNSGAGLPAVSLIPSPSPVPESPDRLTSSSPSPTDPLSIADPPSSSPASPEVVPSVTSVPTRKDSVPQKHAWSTQEPYAIPKSPVPDLPEEVSPWAG